MEKRFCPLGNYQTKFPYYKKRPKVADLPEKAGISDQKQRQTGPFTVLSLSTLRRFSLNAKQPQITSVGDDVKR